MRAMLLVLVQLVAAPPGEFLRSGIEVGIEVHLSPGLPGGRDEVLRLHHLVVLTGDVD